MKSTDKTPVLGPVNKAKHARSKPTAGTSDGSGTRATCEQPVSKTRVRYYSPSSTEILTAIDPVVLRVVHQYLDSPPDKDRMFLDAWERCGRNDAHHGCRVLCSSQARNTMTPLGLACLVRYARGFEDERQAIVAADLT